LNESVQSAVAWRKAVGFTLIANQRIPNIPHAVADFLGHLFFLDHFLIGVNDRMIKPISQSDNNNGQYKDRKSTRLNSSHVSISYAVFCLKKKKKRTSKISRKKYIYRL